MIFRAATLADVSHVIAQASDVTRREMSAAGVSRWNVLKAFNNLRREGAILTGAAPHAEFVFGHVAHPLNPKLRVTLFIATEAFFTGARSIYAGRALMRYLRARHTDVTFKSETASPHPEVGRWYALLGFREVETLDGKRVFILPPKNGIKNRNAPKRL